MVSGADNVRRVWQEGHAKTPKRTKKPLTSTIATSGKSQMIAIVSMRQGTCQKPDSADPTHICTCPWLLHFLWNLF